MTLGERPELRYEVARDWLAENGFDSTVHYVSAVAENVLERTGLIPHINAGALYSDELELLRAFSGSQGMMVEQLVDLEAHRLAPDKSPERRTATLEFAGELAIPFTTGLLVGIGENRLDRINTLQTIASIHERHGHIQEVIIQNFLPKPDTAMARRPAANSEDFLWTIAVARLILPDDVHLQAPPNLWDLAGELLDSGIDDFGGISAVTIDHINPERAWPTVTSLRNVCSERDLQLVGRTCVYPKWQNERFLAAAPMKAVFANTDSDGLLRSSKWFSGGLAEASVESGTVRTSAVQRILSGYVKDAELSEEEITVLFSAREQDFYDVCERADALREELVGPAVTFVNNQNINYTNICTYRCKFCAFSKGPRSLNLRGDPYLISTDEILHRTAKAISTGATEVCLQGGIHPSFDADYYLDLVGQIHQEFPELHIHAFSALEIFTASQRSQIPLAEYLLMLKERGLRTLPGTAAEILDDEIRAVICPDKLSTREWLDVHRIAHSVGIKSNVTIMFGSVEQPVYWARHLLITRQLQKETGGFSEFVPLPFVHMGSPIYLQGKSRKGPTYREAMLMYAVGRLVYGSLIPNIQASWVKMGVQGTIGALAAGANDVGGTLGDENISKAAGALHGEFMTEAQLRDLFDSPARPLHQRNTAYSLLNRRA